MKLPMVTVMFIACFFWNLHTACEEEHMKENLYVLATGEKAKKILDTQHELFAEVSYRHLEEAELAAGKKVYDIGCGSGVMTEYLANKVGEEGHVVAVDISPEQIGVTRARIEEAGLSNVTFITGDMATIDLPEGEADIVYARFFLMHQRKVSSIIKKMKSLLKRGGVLVLEESVMSSHHFSERSDAFDAFVKSLVALGNHKGVNFDIGYQLNALCEAVGFDQILSRSIEFKLPTSKVALTLLARIDELRDGVIGAELATSEQVDAWKEAIGEAFATGGPDSYVTSKQGHILAWK